MKKSLILGVALGTILFFAPLANAQSSWPVFSGKSANQGQVLSVDPARGVLTLAPLLEKVTPAVVDIRVSSTVKHPKMRLGGSELGDEFFERFFGERGVPRGGNDDEGQFMQSAGSGVIINAAKGYILTNYHVVDNADKITVVLKDKREATAKVIGSDKATDIAIIQIELRRLKDVPMADSDNVKVGDYVIAIGNAFGIGQTVTTGIVSALGRSTGGRGNSYQDYIQTDAAINKGNSGGALLNSKGELIGINAAILSRSGGSNGIGFAVPTNMINGVMNQLIKYGEVHRGRIGVTIQNITPEMQEAMNLPSREGALVSNVLKDSPAKKAGIRAGDVIIAFNGEEIRDSNDIRNAVGFVERGKSANITYLRNGREITKKIYVNMAFDDEELGDTPSPDRPADPSSFEAFNGATFGNIPEDLDPQGGENGVVVTKLKRGSDAWQAGLRTGDIIRAVNSTDIKDLDDFKRVIKGKTKAVALSVERGRNRIFIAIKP